MEQSHFKENKTNITCDTHNESDLSLESSDDHLHQQQESRSRVLSLLYTVVMMLISGITMRKHSKYWRRWVVGLGGALYIIVRSSKCKVAKE